MQNFSPIENPPSIVSVSTSGKSFYVSINFNIEISEEGYKYESVNLVLNHYPCKGDYGRFVSSMVRSKYSEDTMEAATFNHFNGDDEYLNEIQEWREKSKSVARDAVRYLEGETSIDSSAAVREYSACVKEEKKKGFFKRLFSK